MSNIPIGGKIPDVDHMFEDDVRWTKGRAVSTLHHTGECGGSSPSSPAELQRQGSVSHQRLCTGKCLCKEKKLRSASELCRTKHDYGRRDYFLLPGGLEMDFRGLTPCLMQSSRPVCCPLTTKEPMQRCESKFVRSFTQAKGRSPWAPSASTLCPGPKMAALVLS